MNISQMVDCLGAAARMASPAAAKHLDALATELAASGFETVAEFLKKRMPSERHPAELRAALVSIADILGGAGAAKQRKGVDALMTLLGTSAGGSIEDFVRDIRRAKPVKGKSSAVSTMVDSMLARNLADDLTNAVLDPDAFAAVVERLKDTKFVSNETVYEIACRFLGSKRSFKSRSTAIAEIARRHEADMREAARGRALSRVPV